MSQVYLQHINRSLLTQVIWDILDIFYTLYSKLMAQIQFQI